MAEQNPVEQQIEETEQIMQNKEAADLDMNALSNEELHAQIIEDKKRANRSMILAFSAFIAVVVVCIAWFVANHIITGGTNDISGGTDSAFELASIGDRQVAEQEHYLKDDTDAPKLSAGKPVEYDSYYDIETGKKVDSKGTTYYLGTSGIAWYQDGQTVMEPGASGKLEFYVIPKKSGQQSMTITLKAEAYSAPVTVGEDGTEVQSKRAKRIDNTILQNMIDGHILIFRHLDDADGYSGWIPPIEAEGEDSAEAGVNGNVFTITAAEAGVDGGAFEVNTVYKITLYWVWPKYFRNYIYNATSLYGDLFADISDQNEDYQELLAFINDQKIMGTTGGSKLFYNKDTTDKVVTDKVINSSISDEVLNVCDKYYNQADEYIGTKAGYIYLSVTVD